MFSRLLLLLGLAVAVCAVQVRINCGGPELPTIGWRADTGKYRSLPSGGFTSATDVNATGSWAPVFNSHAYSSSGDLQYKIPVPAGTYTVSLLFAETFTSTPDTRVFSVTVNGVVVRASLDVYAASGGLLRPLFVPVNGVNAASGFVTVTLGRLLNKQNPMVSGIVIDGVKADALVGGEGFGVVAPPLTVAISPSPSTPGNPSRAVCDVATTVTGRSPGKFSMNIGGGALAAIGYGAENLNYLVGSVGQTATSAGPVLLPGGANAGPVYLSERYNTVGLITYRIPVPAGTYTVSTMHAETYFSVSKARLFNIVINGLAVRSNVDIFAIAGKNQAQVFEFANIPSVDGYITIAFVKVVENPFVNGIVITGRGADTIAIGGLEDGSCTKAVGAPLPLSPSPSASASPSVPIGPLPTPLPALCATATKVTGRRTNAFSMNCGGPALAVPGYGADNVNYIVGDRGSVASSSAVVSVASGSNLPYLTERYTTAQKLTYKIPVPVGLFTVSTMHAETYHTVAGKRVFNIAINGVTRRTNLDVFAAAGARNKAVVSTFTRVPSVKGFITIEFVKGVENPFVNGIVISGPRANRLAIGGREDGKCGTPTVAITPPPVGRCRVANAVTGSIAKGSGFLMNVGGAAVPNIAAGADNVNYIVEANKGIKYTSTAVIPVRGSWSPIFMTQRYTEGASLTYKIPAGKAFRYTVALFHTEPYFDRAGARTFDVSINGKTVLSKLDVFARVGKNNPLYQQFVGITAVDGFITIKLTKVVQNPILNGIYIKGNEIGVTAIGGLEDGSC